MNGTKNNKIKHIIKSGKTNFCKIEISTKDIVNIIKIDRDINIKCFVKKKQLSLSNLSPAKDDVEEKEKNKPKKNNNIKQNNIFLSIFIQ